MEIATDLWLAIDTAVLLVIAVFLSIGAIRNYSSHRNLSYFLSVLTFLFFVSFIVRLLWITGFYNYSDSDLFLLMHIILVLQAFLLYYFVNLFKKNILTKIIFFIYIVSIGLVIVSPLNSGAFNIILSFFFILLIFLNFLDFSQKDLRLLGYFALFYSGISVSVFFLPLLGFSNIPLFVLISNIAFLPVAYLSSFKIEEPRNLKKPVQESILIIFMRYFIFILAFTNLVLIGTLGLHEFSHVLTARYYDCDARAIFFEEGIYPYSEINCLDVSGKNIITLAGPLFPVLIAIVLFFIGSPITQSIAFLATGFNLVAGYKDFVDLGIPGIIIAVLMMFGLFLLLIGILSLARFILRKEPNTKVE